PLLSAQLQEAQREPSSEPRSGWARVAGSKPCPKQLRFSFQPSRCCVFDLKLQLRSYLRRPLLKVSACKLRTVDHRVDGWLAIWKLRLGSFKAVRPCGWRVLAEVASP